jgi:hypothetical protein
MPVITSYMSSSDAANWEFSVSVSKEGSSVMRSGS